MILSEYLRRDPPEGIDCGRWTLLYLKLTGRSDLYDRLSPLAFAKAYASGMVLLRATIIARREGFRETLDPEDGDPVCFLAKVPTENQVREAMGLKAGSFVASIGWPSGVVLVQSEILQGWSV